MLRIVSAGLAARLQGGIVEYTISKLEDAPI